MQIFRLPFRHYDPPPSQLMFLHRVLFTKPEKWPWEVTALVKEGPKSIVKVVK